MACKTATVKQPMNIKYEHGFISMIQILSEKRTVLCVSSKAR